MSALLVRAFAWLAAGIPAELDAIDAESAAEQDRTGEWAVPA